MHTAEDAVAAVRLSAGDLDQESIVVLGCDQENQVLLAVDFAGAPTTGVCDVVDLVLGAVHDPAVLIVGLIRARDTGLFTSAEAEAAEELVASCLVDDVCLRDILVITGDRWRSVQRLSSTGSERTMAVNEHSRHELYSVPDGWADVATKRDLDVLEHPLRADVRAEINAAVTS